MKTESGCGVGAYWDPCVFTRLYYSTSAPTSSSHPFLSSHHLIFSSWIDQYLLILTCVIDAIPGHPSIRVFVIALVAPAKLRRQNHRQNALSSWYVYLIKVLYWHLLLFYLIISSPCMPPGYDRTHWSLRELASTVRVHASSALSCV